MLLPSLSILSYYSYLTLNTKPMDALGINEQLASYIIRPPRASYSLAELGESVFEFKGIVYQRIDFVVPPSEDSDCLEASIYLQKFSKAKPRPTLLYLHANSSSRVTVKNYLKNLIQHFDVVSFDFRGCGLSSGTYLTLGYLEKYDVKAVIECVDSKFGTRKYMIWGRSMGAVTAILYTAEFGQGPQKIAALVLDSPFADLEKVIYSLGNKKLPLLPGFMVESMVGSLEEHVKQKISKQYGKQFLIRRHKPVKQMPKIRVPVFFIGSKADQLVECNHLEELYDKCFCRKELEILEGGHNQIRPEHLKLAIVEFLLAALSFKDQVTRKKIFEFAKSSPFNSPFNVKETQQGQIRDKSKSKPKNSARLFKNETRLSVGLPENSGIEKDKGKEQKKTEVVHAQILDKVLPQNSQRRKGRIFSFLPDSQGHKPL